jgi:ferredoxin-type protein NapF
MTTPDSRRNFLRGNFSPRQGPLRPPWALAEANFLLACTRCGDCIDACPTCIITRDSGYPVVDFARGECTFCGNCAAACMPRALTLTEAQSPWSARAVINAPCLARQRVECRICGDQCAAGAIRFPPLAGGIALPVLDLDRCTGCGACVAPCPVRAIAVR